MKANQMGSSVGVKALRWVWQTALLVVAGFTLAACGGGGSGVISQPGTQEQLLEADNTYDGGYTHVAANAAGAAIVVWFQDNSFGYTTIWANRYVSGSGWQGAQAIASGTSNLQVLPRVGIDSAGNATVVWMSANNGVLLDIYASRYVAGTGQWSAPQAIDAGTDPAGYPQLAVTNSGEAVAVWKQQSGATWHVFANRYTSSGWGTAQQIDGPSAFDASFPQITVDGSGNYTATWTQYDGAYTNVYANRYLVSGGWQSAQVIGNATGDASGMTNVVANASGTVMAVWTQVSGGVDSIYASVFGSGTWGAPQLLESGTDLAETPRAAIDANGNATAVWAQRAGTYYSVYRNSYTAGMGWGTEQLLESANTGDAGLPWVGVDSSGNVTALWTQSTDQDATFSIYANHRTASGSWTGAKLIESGAGDAGAPWGAIDGNGTVIATWEQVSSGPYSIFANRLTF
jgi:hypothetical protein